MFLEQLTGTFRRSSIGDYHIFLSLTVALNTVMEDMVECYYYIPTKRAASP